MRTFGVLVHRSDIDGWWPQGGGEIPITGGRWTVPVTYGDAEDAGFDFEIAAVVVSRFAHEQWMEWVRSTRSAGRYPPFRLPGPAAILATEYRRVRRG